MEKQSQRLHYLELNVGMTEVLCFPKSTESSSHLSQEFQTGCSWCHGTSDHGRHRFQHLNSDVQCPIHTMRFEAGRLVQDPEAHKMLAENYCQGDDYVQ